MIPARLVEAKNSKRARGLHDTDQGRSGVHHGAGRGARLPAAARRAAHSAATVRGRFRDRLALARAGWQAPRLHRHGEGGSRHPRARLRVGADASGAPGYGEHIHGALVRVQERRACALRLSRRGIPGRAAVPQHAARGDQHRRLAAEGAAAETGLPRGAAPGPDPALAAGRPAQRHHPAGRRRGCVSGRLPARRLHGRKAPRAIATLARRHLDDRPHGRRAVRLRVQVGREGRHLRDTQRGGRTVAGHREVRSV